MYIKVTDQGIMIVFTVFAQTKQCGERPLSEYLSINSVSVAFVEHGLLKSKPNTSPESDVPCRRLSHEKKQNKWHFVFFFHCIHKIFLTARLLIILNTASNLFIYKNFYWFSILLPLLHLLNLNYFYTYSFWFWASKSFINLWLHVLHFFTIYCSDSTKVPKTLQNQHKKLRNLMEKGAFISVKTVASIGRRRRYAGIGGGGCLPPLRCWQSQSANACANIVCCFNTTIAYGMLSSTGPCSLVAMTFF